jgi:hypothetical protein
VLKGTLGERQHLKSSATNEPLHFDFEKIHPKCLETNMWHVMKSILDVNVSVANAQQTILRKVQTEVNSTKGTIHQTSNQILMEQSRIQNQSTEQMDVKFERLHSELIAKTGQTDKKILTLQNDVQQLLKNQEKTDKKTAEIPAEIETSIAQQMQNIQNQTIETLISKFESLQSELTTQTNQANKNFEMLQIIVRFLVDDNRKMQAEIKQIAEKKEESAKYDSLKSDILELTNQMNIIRDEILTISERL